MENKKINWYPGHMFKAKKEIQANLKAVDAIIEVVDARCPIVSHNKMLEDIVKNKPKLIIFSKYDLVEPNQLKAFLKYYEKAGYQTFAANITNNKNKDKIIKEIQKLCNPVILKNQKKNINKILRIMIIGMPNVGKSSLINTLAGKKKLIVGNRPGVTKQQQVVKISDNIELVDTPGVLIPKIDKLEDGFNLVLNSLIKDEIVELESISYYLLQYLIKNKKENLINRYPKLIDNPYLDKEEFDIITNEEIYTDIAKSIGAYSKHNGVDYLKVSIRLINDYRNQKFGKIILDKIQYEN